MFENRYSLLDRALHRVAFGTQKLQIEFSSIENRVFADRLRSVSCGPPVFITALPRASTTLLLELLVSQPEFAAHRYRDMPFVTVPLFWHEFSKRFRRGDAPRERAHGDGMLVSVDSPEAFEEILWMSVWEQNYKEDRIVPWGAQEDAEFVALLEQHFKKISWLGRAGGGAENPRYVSKNNGNMARISWLLRAFPAAPIVVPFREPLTHASSLLRVHKKFLDIHARDAFARRYMAGIGHFDFGENLLPIDFGGWLASARHRDPLQLGFWLEYWTKAYEDVLRNPQVMLVSHERLCADPTTSLEIIADRLKVTASGDLIEHGREIRPPSLVPVDTSGVDPGVLKEADRIHDSLLAAATV